METAQDIYSCGSPGIQIERQFSVDGVIYTVGGSNWDFVAGMKAAYGNLLDSALRIFRQVNLTGTSDNPTNDPCDNSDNCTDGEVCGLVNVPYVTWPNSSLIGFCGTQVGWLSPNILCTTFTQVSTEASTKYDVFSAPGLVNCTAYGKDSGQLTPWYSCAGTSNSMSANLINSCYTNDHTINDSNCCGCVDWWEADCSVTLNNTHVMCGLAVSNSTVACPYSRTGNPGWLEAILPSLLWRKLACPTCYTYQYDDPSSTFTCQAVVSNYSDVRAYYIVACPERGGYTLTNISAPYGNLRIVKVFNNCLDPIWPGMAGATSSNLQRVSDKPTTDCTTNSSACSTGTECIFVRTGFSQCYWPLVDPILTNGETGYQLNSNESLEFRMPVAMGIDGPVTWSGSFAMRITCPGRPGDAFCGISDCRGGNATAIMSSNTFMCDADKGFAHPATLAEITFGTQGANGSAGLDFYDVGIIDAPSIGLAWVPGNAIPVEIYDPS